MFSTADGPNRNIVLMAYNVHGDAFVVRYVPSPTSSQGRAFIRAWNRAIASPTERRLQVIAERVLAIPLALDSQPLAVLNADVPLSSPYGRRLEEFLTGMPMLRVASAGTRPHSVTRLSARVVSIQFDPSSGVVKTRQIGPVGIAEQTRRGPR
jgi:hypothetical protein